MTPFSGRRTACGSTQKGVARLEDEATTVGIPKGRRQIELKSHANAGGRAQLSRMHPSGAAVRRNTFGMDRNRFRDFAARRASLVRSQTSLRSGAPPIPRTSVNAGFVLRSNWPAPRRHFRTPPETRHCANVWALGQQIAKREVCQKFP